MYVAALHGHCSACNEINMHCMPKIIEICEKMITNKNKMKKLQGR